MGGEREVSARLADIVDTLEGVGLELEALVVIERFRVQSESGIDPLEHTAFEDHGEGP